MPKRHRNRSAKPKPPVGENASRSARSVSLFGAICPACGKRGYASRQAAKQGAVRIYPGARMRVYQCGSLWHLTSADAVSAAEYREHQVKP
jgi:hypothetical protein